MIFGISDLAAVSVPEEIARYHWGTQGLLAYSGDGHPHAKSSFIAPVRFALFFALTIYSFMFAPAPQLSGSSRYAASGWGGEGLKNRVLFTWSFLEVVTWFWIFITLREERREAAVREAKKRALREEHM
jgi:hypothetical protein